MTIRWDAGVLQDLIAGDDDAVRGFVAHFQPRFSAIARRRGVPPFDCLAIAHEAIADGLQQIQAGRLREIVKVPAFLHAILGNKISNYWRSRGPSTIALDDIPDSRDPALLTAPPSDDV